MPLLDIGNAHPSFHHPLCSFKVQIPCHGKQPSVSFAFGIGQCVPCAWKSLDKHNKVKSNAGAVELGRRRLLVKAVAVTLEPKSLAPKRDEWLGSKDLELGLNPNPQQVLLESSNESSNEDDSEELDEREKLRRMRISKANKGSTPWNKGRKHSAETLRKIKERTKLAMQNPKVKVKLANSWNPQTTETRQKISAAVKMAWERKSKKKVVQETCCIEWLNLIAEASRQGYVGQEELQWNSYETLDERLKMEWSASVEKRKQMPRPPGSKRAPKTPEQRRKIAEAIYAKWADPEYRLRVFSAITKYHGTEGSERKPRRRSSDGAQSTRRNPAMKMDTDTNINVKSSTKVVKQIRLKKGKSPANNDPLACSKPAMMKSIRAQRLVAETKQANAIEQARLYIAEAEKAAKALEVAATKSPIAQASLTESRRLIAEAIQSLESIDTQGMITVNNAPSVALTEFNKEQDAEFEVLNLPLNGNKTLSSSGHEFSSVVGELSSHKLVNGNSERHLTSSNGCASYHVGFNSKREEPSSSYRRRETTEQDDSDEYKNDPSETLLRTESIRDETQPRSSIATKKWIRGRLVEVVE